MIVPRSGGSRGSGGEPIDGPLHDLEIDLVHIMLIADAVEQRNGQSPPEVLAEFLEPPEESLRVVQRVVMEVEPERAQDCFLLCYT